MDNTKPIGRPKTPANARSRMLGISLPPAMEAALRALADMEERGISHTVRMLLKSAPNPEWQRLLASTVAQIDAARVAARANALAKAKAGEAEDTRLALASPYWNPAKAAQERARMASGKSDDDSDDDFEI